jgi:DNA-binding NarL/FixJ family response regulator
MMQGLPRALRPAGSAKPKVLLVDDHRGVLERVSTMLGDDFDVAGMATDGMQALDRARQTDPDAIVLDIQMPGLDGFQTVRALRQTGSQVPVVFLSMVRDEDIVVEALRRGGQGYVPKTHMARDLVSALDHVLDGRVVAPSMTALFELAGAHGHAMHLYEDLSFVEDLAASFDLALRRLDACCVIATEDIRVGLTTRLTSRGWDVANEPRLQIIDAADALNRFMRDGLPDVTELLEVASELDQSRRNVSASRLMIFGNMSDVLKRGGNTQAMMALERLWSQVTEGLPFFTVCGYIRSSFNDSAPDAWSVACEAHQAISHMGL